MPIIEGQGNVAVLMQLAVRRKQSVFQRYDSFPNCCQTRQLRAEVVHIDDDAHVARVIKRRRMRRGIEGVIK